MKRISVLSLTATAVLVIALGAFGMKSYLTSKAPEPRAQAPTDLSGADQPAGSADKVRVDVANDDQGIVITLDIEEGWHVNATPASMEFLIPTTVTAHVGDRLLEIPTTYPKGKKSDVDLNGTMIEVYDDGAQIRLGPDEQIFEELAAENTLDLSVQVQSCSDSGICLAPSDIKVAVPMN